MTKESIRSVVGMLIYWPKSSVLSIFASDYAHHSAHLSIPADHEFIDPDPAEGKTLCNKPLGKYFRLYLHQATFYDEVRGLSCILLAAFEAGESET